MTTRQWQYKPTSKKQTTPTPPLSACLLSSWSLLFLFFVETRALFSEGPCIIWTKVERFLSALLRGHTCLCDVSLWCVFVSCLCEVSLWCVFLMCLFEVSLWCVSAMCLCEVSFWGVNAQMRAYMHLCKPNLTDASFRSALHPVTCSPYPKQQVEFEDVYETSVFFEHLHYLFIGDGDRVCVILSMSVTCTLLNCNAISVFWCIKTRMGVFYVEGIPFKARLGMR